MNSGVRLPQLSTTRQRPLRLIGLLATTVGVTVGTLHLLAVLGRTPISPLAILGAAFPVSIVAALTYIVATHKYGDSLHRPPTWVFGIWFMVGAYAFINFRLEKSATSGGHVETINGTPTLVLHGRSLRQLDEAQVHAIKIWDIRALSGHMLPFLLIPGLALLYAVPRDRRASIPKRAVQRTLQLPKDGY